MIPEAITKDLKAGLSLDETLTKYGTNLRELFMQNQNKTPVSTGVKPTRRGGYRRNKPRYYYHRKKDDMWVIQRIINGEKPYLGEYKTEKAAVLAVSLFEKYGWTPENNWRVKYEVKQMLGGDY